MHPPSCRLPSPTPTPTTNLLARPITRHLLPLHLLPRDGQLPPQPLELPLAQPREPPVHLLLPRLLRPRHRPHDLAPQQRVRGRHRRRRERLAAPQPHVAVLVVVHVAREVAAQGPAGGVVEVRGAEAAVPEVCGGVFVGDEEDGEGAAAAVVVGGVGGVGGWDDGVGGAGWGVVFAGVGGEGFGEGCSVGPAAGAGGGFSFCSLFLMGWWVGRYALGAR